MNNSLFDVLTWYVFYLNVKMSLQLSRQVMSAII